MKVTLVPCNPLQCFISHDEKKLLVVRCPVYTYFQMNAGGWNELMKVLLGGKVDTICQLPQVVLLWCWMSIMYAKDERMWTFPPIIKIALARLSNDPALQVTKIVGNNISLQQISHDIVKMPPIQILCTFLQLPRTQYLTTFCLFRFPKK